MEVLINKIVELVLSNSLDNINYYIERLRNIPNEPANDIMKKIENQMFHEYFKIRINSHAIPIETIKVYESFFDKHLTTSEKERINTENRYLSIIRENIKSINVVPTNYETFLEKHIKNIELAFKYIFTNEFHKEINDITSDNILYLYNNVKDKFNTLFDEWASCESGQIETELKNNATGDSGGNDDQNNKDKTTSPSISQNPGQRNLRTIDNINYGPLICSGSYGTSVSQLKGQSKFRVSPYHFRRLPQIPILLYPIGNRIEQKTMQFLNPYPVFANPYMQVAHIEVLRQALAAGIYYEFTDCRTILPSQITYPTPNITSNLIGPC